jgi:holo-[acyl-carrier protein] synthase
MIVGLGIDVTSIERQRAALERFGERLWQRILTENEQADLAHRSDRALALAGRFAAKEAAAKALGGQPDVWWQHIEIRANARGAPELAFRGPACAHAERLGVNRIWVSITHDAGVAAAVVVLEGNSETS